MNEPTAPGGDRITAALALLEPFVRRQLPVAMRRLACRRGYTDPRRLDLQADLRQELRLDCVQHADLILQLAPPDRHQRWFRLAERWTYRQRLRVDRVGEGRPARDPLPGLAAADDGPDPDVEQLLPGLPRPLLDSLGRHSRHRANGRVNLAASAAPLGLQPRQLRRIWEDAAEQLGYGSEFLTFWRHRLGEALTGLAADLLRDRGSCALLDEPRPRPDPTGRQRRLRRIRDLLAVRPLPPDLRRALSPELWRGAAARLDPRVLLAQALRVMPDTLAVQLWAFEAALGDGDHRAAAQHLLAARAIDRDHRGVLLARARLLEANDRLAGAVALLRRAHARRGGRDAGLAAALAAAGR